MFLVRKIPLEKEKATWASTLIKGKTIIILDNACAFGAAQGFWMLWKHYVFLISNRNKILNGLYVQELLDTIF